ncbi:MAG: hypothetical protein H6540_04630 [Bacteroidales bacterium]|nr:hypothetical protein [Bacteroidales bacterium]
MKRKILNYNEAKAYLKPLGLKSKEEYDAWWNANRPEFLPQYPEEYYKTMKQEEIENPNQKTLDEVLEEIREVIENSHWVETRLAKLKASGFQIELCWVKNGSIATVWYMKRKKEFRIQVSDSELHGEFQKAFCVVIPEANINIKASDASRVRWLSRKSNSAPKEGNIKKEGNNSII